MVRYLFQIAPGPRWARWVVAVLLAVGVVAALFAWVFPAVEPLLSINDQTVG